MNMSKVFLQFSIQNYQFSIYTDLGKKISAFSKFDKDGLKLLGKLK